MLRERTNDELFDDLLAVDRDLDYASWQDNTEYAAKVLWPRRNAIVDEIERRQAASLARIERARSG